MTLSNTLTALELPLKFLVVHPQNVRAPGATAAPNAIAALAANIRAVGLLQPLLVQELSKGALRCSGGRAPAGRASGAGV